MFNLLGVYQNGNYIVKIFNDGTKIRMTNDDNFVPSFAENCDVKITDKCDGNCPYCYEGCTVHGKHAELLNVDWIDTLHPYTELAINGNDLSHPQLVRFLEKLKSKKVIANMTVNQKHFMEHFDFINELIRYKLVNGLGVSLIDPTPEFIEKIKKFPNAVIHVINGVCKPEWYEAMANQGLKILILGYKELRRGVDYLETNHNSINNIKAWVYDNLPELIKWFKVVSFDNLAIEQLEVRRIMSEKEWESFFMGVDSEFTFYIDMVSDVFAKNSLSMDRHPIMNNIDAMFETIRYKGN